MPETKTRCTASSGTRRGIAVRSRSTGLSTSRSSGAREGRPRPRPAAGRNSRRSTGQPSVAGPAGPADPTLGWRIRRIHQNIFWGEEKRVWLRCHPSGLLLTLWHRFVPIETSPEPEPRRHRSIAEKIGLRHMASTECHHGNAARPPFSAQVVVRGRSTILLSGGPEDRAVRLSVPEGMNKALRLS